METIAFPIICRNCGVRGDVPWEKISKRLKCGVCGSRDLDLNDKIEATIKEAEFTAPGYYILRNGAPAAGPFGTPSEAEASLSLAGGDAIEWMDQPSAKGNTFLRPFMSPSGYQADSYALPAPPEVLAKVTEITKGILASNPGMPQSQAQHIAIVTVQKHPELVKREQ
jgi:hypothetical protein